jgi:hypothetical protein
VTFDDVELVNDLDVVDAPPYGSRCAENSHGSVIR